MICDSPTKSTDFADSETRPNNNSVIEIDSSPSPHAPTPNESDMDADSHSDDAKKKEQNIRDENTNPIRLDEETYRDDNMDPDFDCISFKAISESPRQDDINEGENQNTNVNIEFDVDKNANDDDVDDLKTLDYDDDTIDYDSPQQQNDEPVEQTSEVERPSMDLDDGSEMEYNVERIIDKRIENGVVLYHVKWEGYPPSSNTWEPVENMGRCDDIVKKFEFDVARKIQSRMARSKNESLNQECSRSKELSRLEMDEPELISEAELGNKEYQIDRIHGATKIGSVLYFLVSLVGQRKVALLRSQLANKMIPSKVIDFYISKLKWKVKN